VRLEQKATAWCITDFWYVSQLNTNCEPSIPALPALPSSHDHSTEGDTASHISSQYLSSDDEGNDTGCILPLVSTTRTPQVLWHQDECTIYLKIMIPGVQKYHIEWNVMHLRFRYEYLGKSFLPK
jgi:hypothetical protein